MILKSVTDAEKASSHIQQPYDELFGHKTQHAKREHQEQHKGAELASFRFACQLVNDEQHVEHEARHAKGEPDLGELFFRHDRSMLACVVDHQVTVSMPTRMAQHGHHSQ